MSGETLDYKKHLSLQVWLLSGAQGRHPVQ
jgi:hypothetical protein